MKKKTKIKNLADLRLPFDILVENDGSAFDDTFVRLLTTNKEVAKMILDLPDKKELMHRSDSQLSDDQFFEYLKEDSDLLRSTLAKQKIGRWQREASSNDEGKAYRAKQNLNRISPALLAKTTVSDPESKSIEHDHLCVAQFRGWLLDMLSHSIPEEMEEILAHVEGLTGKKILDDKDICQKLLDAPYSNGIHPGLATLVTAKVFGYAEGTVKQILKNIIEVQIDEKRKTLAIETRQKKDELS